MKTILAILFLLPTITLAEVIQGNMDVVARSEYPQYGAACTYEGTQNYIYPKSSRAISLEVMGDQVKVPVSAVGTVNCSSSFAGFPHEVIVPLGSTVEYPMLPPFLTDLATLSLSVSVSKIKEKFLVQVRCNYSHRCGLNGFDEVTMSQVTPPQNFVMVECECWGRANAYQVNYFTNLAAEAVSAPRAQAQVQRKCQQKIGYRSVELRNCRSVR